MEQVKLFMRKKIAMKSDYIAGKHRHHFWQLEQANKTTEIKIEEKSFIVSPDHVLLIPPLVEHSISYYENTCVKSIKFDFKNDSLSTDSIVIIDFNKYNDILNMLFEQIPYRENSYNSRLTSLYLEIFMLTVYEKEFNIPDEYRHITDTVIRNAVIYINDHLFNNLPLKHFASLSGLSENHFIRRFKNIMNYTPLEYIRKVRIERAVALIEDTDFNISQIAELLNYSSLYSFSRSFKKIMGVSPSIIVKRLRK
jgi:AraC-like DNA-binding protein